MSAAVVAGGLHAPRSRRLSTTRGRRTRRMALAPPQNVAENCSVGRMPRATSPFSMRRLRSVHSRPTQFLSRSARCERSSLSLHGALLRHSAAARGSGRSQAFCVPRLPSVLAPWPIWRGVRPTSPPGSVTSCGSRTDRNGPQTKTGPVAARRYRCRITPSVAILGGCSFDTLPAQSY